MEDTRTPLRHDLMYMRGMARTAIRLHQKRTQKDRDVVEVLHDYLTWLAVDAMTDEELAQRLVHTLAKLQEELHTKAESNHVHGMDPIPPAFYEGLFHGLEQVISLRYGIDLLFDEEISRGEFLASWEQIRESLGL